MPGLTTLWIDTPCSEHILKKKKVFSYSINNSKNILKTTNKHKINNNNNNKKGEKEKKKKQETAPSKNLKLIIGRQISAAVVRSHTLYPHNFKTVIDQDTIFLQQWGGTTNNCKKNK